jgi:diaminopimelate epimerase
MEFSKYQGLGNDFILIDNRGQSELRIPPDRVPGLCDRHFGIGADGVIFLLQAGDNYWMRIINRDGSEPEMCGNGIRCLAKFMVDLGIPPIENQYRVQTLAGEMVLHLNHGLITVDMGLPRLLAKEIPTTLADPNQQVVNLPLKIDEQEWQVTCVSMGNPHCVTFIDRVDPLDLAQIGVKFEHHPAFPQRINTEFVEVIDRSHVRVRVWERGAGATLACGTGACAVVVAGVLNNLTDRVCQVDLPGGSLQISWQDRVWMTGDAQRVYRGQIDLWC